MSISIRQLPLSVSMHSMDVVFLKAFRVTIPRRRRWVHLHLRVATGCGISVCRKTRCQRSRVLPAGRITTASIQVAKTSTSNSRSLIDSVMKNSVGWPGSFFCWGRFCVWQQRVGHVSIFPIIIQLSNLRGGGVQGFVEDVDKLGCIVHILISFCAL